MNDADQLAEAIRELRSNWYYEVAEQDINAALPPNPPAMLSFERARMLMIAMWLRGMTWERLQMLSAKTETSP